jgi:adenylate kinase
MKFSIEKHRRTRPNILVTGTPGTGKSTFCEMLSIALEFKHIDLSEWIKDKELYTGFNTEFDCYDLDEDKVCDELEPMMDLGGIMVDFHTCDFFPERWFDLIVVLRADTEILYDRLMKR